MQGFRRIVGGAIGLVLGVVGCNQIAGIREGTLRDDGSGTGSGSSAGGGSSAGDGSGIGGGSESGVGSGSGVGSSAGGGSGIGGGSGVGSSTGSGSDSGAGSSAGGGSGGAVGAAGDPCSTDSDCENKACLPKKKCDSPPTAPKVEVGSSNPNFQSSALVSKGFALKCKAESSFDPDNDNFVYEYAWSLNGNPTSFTSNSVPHTETSVGDEWMCTVTPYDGYLYGKPGTASLTVCNPAQEIIATDTTWNAEGSPYCPESVKVNAGATLTIGPGTKIHKGNFSVSGQLKVEGAEPSMVEFYNVVILGDSQSFLDIQSTRFKGLYHLIHVSGIINLRDSLFYQGPTLDVNISSGSSIIKQNVFVKDSKISTALSNTAALTIKNNLFMDHINSPAVTNSASSSPTSVVAQYNSFLSTGYTALQLESCDLGSAIVGTHNYWGTNNDNEIKEMIFDNADDSACTGSIPYSPPLLGPHNDTPKPPMNLP